VEGRRKGCPLLPLSRGAPWQHDWTERRVSGVPNPNPQLPIRNPKFRLLDTPMRECYYPPVGEARRLQPTGENIMRKSFLSALAVCVVFGVVFAEDACDKPYSKWNKSFVSRMLTDSNWVRPFVLGRVLSQTEADDRVSQTHFPDWEQSRSPVRRDHPQRLAKGPGIAGEKEIVDAYTIRLFSALPVRQAFVRQFQIDNKYDRMPASDKARLDGQFAQALAMDFPQTRSSAWSCLSRVSITRSSSSGR
jgi:hypothetical protein